MNGQSLKSTDNGIMLMLPMTVQNIFIDLLPLFTSAILALVLIFSANLYVGLVALLIVAIYFPIVFFQARKLKGWRRDMRSFREKKSHGIMNIIESINVIKSFNRLSQISRDIYTHLLAKETLCESDDNGKDLLTQ